MDKPKEPARRIEVQPDEDIWTAMARELAANPDSPASLQIMSTFNQVMQPRSAAADQLVEALALQLEAQDSHASRAAVDAAVAYWEKACATEMTDDVMQQCRTEAQDVVSRRRRQPPPIESIVFDAANKSDVGYDLGVHMQGLRGAWHRLWASISSARLWGETQEQQDCVATVRGQVEEQLGRPLSSTEWEQLTKHAHHHCDTVMKPLMQAFEAQHPAQSNDKQKMLNWLRRQHAS